MYFQKDESRGSKKYQQDDFIKTYDAKRQVELKKKNQFGLLLNQPILF